MTKKLEELFNLPEKLPEDVTMEQAVASAEEHKSVFKDIDTAID